MSHARAALLALLLLLCAATAASAKTATHHHAATHQKTHKKHAAKKKHKAKKHTVKKHKAKAKHPAPAVKAPAVPTDGPAPAASDAPLAPGAGRFWAGPTVASGDVPDPSDCGVTGPCFSWPLNVSAGGGELRIAIDTPLRTNSFEVDVVDPSGKVTSVTNSNAFDAEAYVAKPAGGTYTVRVMPQDVSDASFRMRAELEPVAPAAATGPKHALLPDLAADPPTEFTFVAPANPANGVYPPDTVNPPLDVLGVHPLSCSVDEMAPTVVYGGDAHKCLRFTSGPMNVGAGPYEMHWTWAQDIVDGKIQSPIAHGPMFQTVHYSDGSTVTRAAGTYSFHVPHAHFHDDGILTMDLYKVGADSTLTKVGTGSKSGFCPANQLLADWRSFSNQPKDDAIGSGDIGTGNCQNPEDGVLGLSPGWGDVYRWQRPGMYVEFGGQPDGLYVVRIIIDAQHDVLESSYANNTAYALVKVTGDQVQEIERGQGDSPFDPHKVVFTGAGPASRD